MTRKTSRRYGGPGAVTRGARASFTQVTGHLRGTIGRAAMRNLVPGRRRAEEFAQLLDGAPAGTGSGSAAPLPQMMSLAGGLHALRFEPARPPSAAVRQRLVAAAAARYAPAPAVRRTTWGEWIDSIRAQRGLAALTATLTVVVALVGLTVGAHRALPGDAMYGLKLRAEHVQLVLSDTAEERGRMHLQFAERRLDEVAGLLHRNRAVTPGVVGRPNAAGVAASRALAGQINDTLVSMDNDTDQGADEMRAAYQQTGDRQPLAYLNDFANVQRATLRGVLPELPVSSKSSASHSLALVNQIRKQTTTLLGQTCEPAQTCVPPASIAPTTVATQPAGEHGALHGTDLPTPTTTTSTEPTAASGVQPTGSSSSGEPVGTVVEPTGDPTVAPSDAATSAPADGSDPSQTAGDGQPADETTTPQDPDGGGTGDVDGTGGDSSPAPSPTPTPTPTASETSPDTEGAGTSPSDPPPTSAAPTDSPSDAPSDPPDDPPDDPQSDPQSGDVDGQGPGGSGGQDDPGGDEGGPGGQATGDEGTGHQGSGAGGQSASEGGPDGPGQGNQGTGVPAQPAGLPAGADTDAETPGWSASVVARPRHHATAWHGAAWTHWRHRFADAHATRGEVTRAAYADMCRQLFGHTR